MSQFSRRSHGGSHPQKISQKPKTDTNQNENNSSPFVVQMQGLIGNKAVQRLLNRPTIQRDDAASPPVENPTLRDWPTALPAVKRSKEQKITKVKGEAQINIPDVDIPGLTPPQSDIVKKIAQNRAGLSPALEKLKLVPYKEQKNAGYLYNGSASNKMKGDDPAGIDPKRKKVIDAIRTEISREGGWSAVNTYDDAVVTLGRGFTRSALAQVMQMFFKLDPDAKNTFLDLGITWDGGTAKVVNTATGGIEEGDNALHLIQFEPQILSVFVQMAESEAHSKNLIKAQESNMQALKVPQTIVDTWSDIMAIRLVAHLIHWRSAKQWSHYVDCKDDIRKILMVVRGSINGGKQDPDKAGAYVTTPEQTRVLFSFADGKAKEAVTGPYNELPPLEPNALSDDILFTADDGKKFYSTVRLGKSE